MLHFLFPYCRGAVALAHRLVTLACVALFLGIVWFDVGAGVNVPALVWHDRWEFQLAAGFSVAALFAYVWLVTFLLDSRFDPTFIDQAARRSRADLDDESARPPLRAAGRWVRLAGVRVMGHIIPPGPTPGGHGDGLRWYLGVTFVWCAVLLLPPVVIAVTGQWPWVRVRDPDAGTLYLVRRWPFAVGVALTFVGFGVATRVGGWVRRRALVASQRGFVREGWLHTVAGLLFATLAVVYATMLVAVEADLWHPPPVTAVCALFGLFVGAAGAVWFHLRLWAVPVLIGLVGWLVYCNLSPYKIRFPHLDPEYAAIARLEEFEEPARSAEELAADGDEATTPATEAERVCRLVAAVQAQHDPRATVADRTERLRAGGLADPARYPDLLAEYERAVRRLTDDEERARRAWRAQFPGRKPKLVLVTTTGGANRSALWTTTVLSQLHADPGLPDFARQVRVITGASGGMVGAAYYVGSLEPGGGLRAGFRPDDVAQDFLTPIINGFVFREVPFLAVPAGYTRDRGELLDRAMEGEVPGVQADVAGRLRAVFAQTFADLAPGEAAGWRPSLIFSPMIVEDGRRLLISNRHVPFLAVTTGNFLLPNRPTFGDEPAPSPAPATAQVPAKGARRHVVPSPKAGSPGPRPRARQQDVYSRPAVEFFRLFPEARSRFRLSTAARMNATFPFLSPAVSLPTDAPRRVVDAGYFDNTGVGLAAAWLYEHADWAADNCSGVVVIQVRDSASHRENRALSLPAAEGRPFLPGLSGPLSAVSHARTASASYRNDDDLQRLGDYFTAHPVSRRVSEFFTTVVFERDGEAGMNWYLSEADKASVTRGWATDETMNPPSLRKLRQWWATH